MSTLAELLANLTLAVPDSKYDATWRTKMLNNGLKTCARLVRLPALESSGTVTTLTTGPLVDIPTAWSFHRGLYAAEVDEASDIQIVGSRALLLRHYPNAEVEEQSGDIEYVTQVNGQILYYPIPATAVDLTVYFYTQPEELVNGTDEVVCLPEEYQTDLLESYVKWQMYRLIEDGAENKTPNTDRFKRDFFEAIALLDQAFDKGQSWAEPDRESEWI